MADYSDPLGLLFGGVDYFGSPQQGKGLLQLTPQEIERMAAAQSPAFGVFPQMQPYRSQQDITASANVPVDVVRGRIAGTRGLFGDVVNQPIPMIRPLQLLSQALTGQQKYPDTEYYLDTMPLKSDTPIGNVAERIGSFAPINPMPAVRGVQKLGGLLGEEMATRLSTGRPILPSLLAEPQTAMFAVNPAEQAMTSGLLQAEVSPLGFYSAVEQQALKIPRKQGTGESFLNDLLKGQDVKKYEIEAMGLDTYLKGKPNVTRQEVQDFIQNNKINVEERQLGGTVGQDPIGIAKRKEIFDKYDPQIQALDNEKVQYATNIVNARNLAKKNYAEANAALNRENLFGSQPIPTTEDWNRYYLANAELERMNKIPLDTREFERKINALRDARDAEANAAYVVPEPTPTEYDRYQLAGGENYRELLLKLPQKPQPLPENFNVDAYSVNGKTMYGVFDEAGSRYASGETKDQALQKFSQLHQEKPYQSSHFPDPNILAHMRVNDRVDAEGKKMLLIEEVQSDWHQAGREQGYNNPKEQALAQEKIRALKAEHKRLGQVKELESSPLERSIISQQRFDLMNQVNELSKVGKSGIPDAPFKDTWYQLALKRAIKEAVDKGYDRIGLTTGKRQIERYTDELRQNVSEINFQTGEKLTPAESAELKALRQQQTYMTGTERQRYEYLYGQEGAPVNQDETLITAFNGSRPAFTGKVKNGKFIEGPNKALGKTVEEVLGKSIAKQIEEKKTGSLTGDNLTIGGEGMKKYYDEVYPNYLEKYGKKYGAQVGDTTVNVGKVQSKDELAKQLYGNNETYKNLPSEQKRKVDVMFMDMSKDEPVRYLDITPEMKKAVQKGQPLAAVEGMTGLLA